MSEHEAENPLARYGAMVELAERQLAAARRGEMDKLEDLAAAWEKLALEVPENPPAAAAPLLRAAAALVERTKEQLARAQKALLGEIGLTAKAARAARGYRVQSSDGSQIDRCA